MRLFVAVETPEPVRAAIWRSVDRDRADFRGARWVRPEGVHLTLVFLGEVADGAVAALESAGRAACAAGAAFVARLSTAGWFPPGRPARTLWVGLEPRPELASLQERVVAAAGAALTTAGAPPPPPAPARPFHPHLTLARCEPPWPRPSAESFVAALAGVAGVEFPVREVVLMRSQLGPGGSRYEALARWPLAGPS